MGRLAVVTGGTRGIGRAISIALKNAGYKVVANYGGNDEAARKFTEETGIPSLKWDVSSYPACEAAIAKVDARLELASSLRVLGHMHCYAGDQLGIAGPPCHLHGRVVLASSGRYVAAIVLEGYPVSGD